MASSFMELVFGPDRETEITRLRAENARLRRQVTDAKLEGEASRAIAKIKDDALTSWKVKARHLSDALFAEVGAAIASDSVYAGASAFEAIKTADQLARKALDSSGMVDIAKLNNLRGERLRAAYKASGIASEKMDSALAEHIRRFMHDLVPGRGCTCDVCAPKRQAKPT